MWMKKKVDTIERYKVKDEFCALFLFKFFVCLYMGEYLEISICLEERESRTKVTGN